MITLAFPSPELQALRSTLRHERLESAAILLCVPVKLDDEGAWRLLVRETHIVPENSYIERSAIQAHVSAEFALPIEKRARQHGLSLVYVHTHPTQEEASFSVVDDETEEKIAAYLSLRIPKIPHISLLFSKCETKARIVGTDSSVKLMEIGRQLEMSSGGGSQVVEGNRYDRQIRAFGEDGQKRLAGLSVGIVGLGGTGSLIAQQLAHLGVGQFTLIDDDLVETTNLNRIVGANTSDIGQSKVSVASRMIKTIQASASTQVVQSNVLDPGISRKLITADFIFSCTDTHASRHLLNQIAHQYYIPLIDVGVSITVRPSVDIILAGHAIMTAPGLSCLWCAKHLDPRLVREELMSEEQRNADPYFQGASGVAQPAVISLNGTVTSLAVTMFLSTVVGIPATPTYLLYDGNRGRVNAVSLAPNPFCNFCGKESTAGMGDTAPLPERHHA